MRAMSEEVNGVTVKAYAGTTGVILAMNIDDSRREGLLGFGIERVRLKTNKRDWLAGGLHFPGKAAAPGEFAASNQAPIQKFRWSDYCVYPDERYLYTIHPVYGTPDHPEPLEGPDLEVQTESLAMGEHRVIFNRAVAASQAFSRKFSTFIEEYEAARKARQPAPPLPSAALKWLTRGLLEQILTFIGRAENENWALDIAIYEFELPAIIEAVQLAHARGARVRVVFHAKPGDEQTEVNLKNLTALPEPFKRARVTHKICHHKFIVLSQKIGEEFQPQAVLCGSTNFTENGVYRQANVVHIVENNAVAAQYAELFKVLFRGDDVRSTRKWINKSNLFAKDVPVFAGFSPRSKLMDLAHFVETVDAARRDVLFCTAFRLYDPLTKALLGQPNDPILRYGLQNTRSQITGCHADRTADFVATALLPKGLEGWIRETTVGQRGNIFVHTKIVIVDFTSDSPLVISGSHNLSKGASGGNDENYLVLRNVPGIVDTYGCEVMRLYDHYRFRFRTVEAARQKKNKLDTVLTAVGVKKEPLALSTDHSWTDKYFGGKPLSTHDRLRFAGAAVE